jgi:uncharacterized membrane protein
MSLIEIIILLAAGIGIFLVMMTYSDIVNLRKKKISSTASSRVVFFSVISVYVIGVVVLASLPTSSPESISMIPTMAN